jgi:serine/threonine protein kinase
VIAVKEPLHSRDVMREVEILHRTSHPAILGLVGFVAAEGDLSAQLVVEWLPNGSLDALLKKPEVFGGLSATQKVKAIVGICTAMRRVHATGSVHRDLKPSHILFDANWEIRISGFAKDEDLGQTMNMADMVYRAPETMVSKTSSPAADVYAFAMVLWSIITGRRPQQELAQALKAPLGFMVKVRKGLRPPVDGLSGPVAGLLERCWATDPADRPMFEGVLEDLRSIGYGVIEGADLGEVDEYLGRLTHYEENHPPVPQ